MLYQEDYKSLYRSSSPEVFLTKGVLKICNKFTGEHPCRSASNFIEIEDYKSLYRSSSPEVFLTKGVLKICNKFTGEHPCRSASNFIEIVLRHGRSSVICCIFRSIYFGLILSVIVFSSWIKSLANVIA